MNDGYEILILERDCDGQPCGILDTPCRPSRYYSGPIFPKSRYRAINASNETYLFHRTQNEALNALAEMTKGSES